MVMASLGYSGTGFEQGEGQLSACCIASIWVFRRGRYPQCEIIRKLTTHRYATSLSVSRDTNTCTPLACLLVILDTHMAVVTSIRSASYDQQPCTTCLAQSSLLGLVVARPPVQLLPPSNITRQAAMAHMMSRICIVVSRSLSGARPLVLRCPAANLYILRHFRDLPRDLRRSVVAH
jgi:hypothetical protein